MNRVWRAMRRRACLELATRPLSSRLFSPTRSAARSPQPVHPKSAARVAMMVIPPPPSRSTAITSYAPHRNARSREIASVTRAANVTRSTAKAWPAGTAHSRAISSSNEPARRISSFSSHGAVFSLSDFSEFEHTSSAKSAVWCAGVERTGRISNNSTSKPRRAHCHAASDPASPAPMILMIAILSA